MTKKSELIEDEPIEKLISNSKLDKYKIIPLAARWAKELKQKEEYKYLTTGELLDIALRDIFTGKIPSEEIAKLPPIEEKKKVNKKSEIKV